MADRWAGRAGSTAAHRGWWLLRCFAGARQELVERFGRLTWRQRLDLGVALVGDLRLPLAVRLLIPAIVVFLALPLDIIPDFIPVIGALDHVLIVLLALRLLLRAIPDDGLHDHFERLDLRARSRFDRKVVDG